MTKTPLSPYEQASYDLNLFRERRIAERRKADRHTSDRRKGKKKNGSQPDADTFPEGMH
ncbi:hypothetical protein NB640_04325 [Oxalobacter vibrioformis]|uniref:Uncharacterized protein n=1 Tax=Oxalobacter vibrioformis TaxID=933080 RepID=A0A9E9LY82_9BURK|nr:hypothetical protein [Oxalobacter vibrioformis]NLC23431.1 hypothetical protein [Oxalobacter sp.]WAW10877.1 hypothetical protein NB640_04325 [Oxalobacter vibrioformis]